MRVYGVQFDIAWEDKEVNYRRVRDMLAAAAPEAGGLIVLPEMFATGFSMNVAHIAEAKGGPTEAFVGELARNHQCYVVAGVVTRSADGRGQNEAVVLGPEGSELARYCKMHPFSLGKEHEHYAAGERVVTVACGEFTVAPLVCYDLRFPEIFRAAVGEGATLYPVIANWPEVRAAHWTALLRARAIENQAYVVGVNRCGQDPKCNHLGQSVIVDPLGVTLAEATAEEQVLQADLDPTLLEAYRQRFPALRDMRGLE